MATQIAERRADPVAVVRQTLTTMGDQLKMALPAHVGVDKFHRCTMTAIQANPDLLMCDRRSLFGAIVKAAQDGLLPDGREGALVKFRTKINGQYVDAVQWMPMVAGILKKVRQSGELAGISANVVYEADDFIYRLGDDEVIEHAPPRLDKPRGKPIGVYAIATLTSGHKVREVMGLEDIERVRAVSRAKDNGPWAAWWGEMARKTVIRRLSKRLPMSTDIEAEFQRDETMQADTAAHLLTSQPQADEQPMTRLDALEHSLGTPDDGNQAGPAGGDADDNRDAFGLQPIKSNAPLSDQISNAATIEELDALVATIPVAPDDDHDASAILDLREAASSARQRLTKGKR